jgi:DNA-binding IclR family transcriptional regulator
MGHRAQNAETRRSILVHAIPCLTAQLGMPPLMGEIAEHVGMDLKTVRKYMVELQAEGRVTQRGGTGTRTIRMEPS